MRSAFVSNGSARRKGPSAGGRRCPCSECWNSTGTPRFESNAPAAVRWTSRYSLVARALVCGTVEAKYDSTTLVPCAVPVQMALVQARPALPVVVPDITKESVAATGAVALYRPRTVRLAFARRRTSKDAEQERVIRDLEERVDVVSRGIRRRRLE